MGRILVADDHDSLRRGIVRALSDAHHEVDEAPNGNIAIEKLHEAQYDVVLSDLKMGGSDGLEVLRAVRREFRAAYYRERGVEPGPLAWYRVLPDWQQAIVLGLAIAAPAVGLIAFLMR